MIGLGCFWDGSGFVLGSVWHRFGMGWESLWDGFAIVFGSVPDRLECVRVVIGECLGMFFAYVGMVSVPF